MIKDIKRVLKNDKEYQNDKRNEKKREDSNFGEL